MDYSTFTTKDFIMDAQFQQWVLAPEPAIDAFWQSWVEQHPEKRTEIEEAIQAIHLFRQDDDTATKKEFTEVWKNIKSEITQDSVPQTPEAIIHSLRPQRERNNHWQKMAAMWTGLILVASTLLYVYIQYNNTIRYTTAYGENKTFTLPDGSTVELNANSSLKFPKEWPTENTREIWLEGEAFFNVTKKSGTGSRKFIVHTNKLNIEVLGTAFNVNTRRGKSQVVLNSGKVKLSTDRAGKQDSIFMQPGELVEFSETNAVFTKTIVNPELYSSWKNDLLIFDKTSVADIALMLEDTYGWEITIKDPEISRMTFTSIVPVKKPEIILSLLTESFHVNITRKENQVIIEKDK